LQLLRHRVTSPEVIDRGWHLLAGGPVVSSSTTQEIPQSRTWDR
jgi:hypothetical protein